MTSRAAYDPKGNSKDKSVEQVRFVEAAPPQHLNNIVHRFIHLQTESPLRDPYRFHALPDACTYLVFDQIDPRIAGVTKLRASSEELDLGHAFHFVNVRFLPGVWQGARDQLAHGQVDSPYEGDLPLCAVNEALAGQSFERQQSMLAELVDDLHRRNIVVENPVTQMIFAQMDDIYSVADMAEAAQLSPRQLQRKLKATTGFTPHDFLKILRLQQSLAGEPSLSYTDQSHFIHAFRAATGYTPGRFAKKFDV